MENRNGTVSSPGDIGTQTSNSPYAGKENDQQKSQNLTEKNTPDGNEKANDSEPLDLSSMTDFELAEVFLRRRFIRKIDGELYQFNGKCFVLLDDKLLNRMILGAFQNEIKQIRSAKKIKAIADALLMFDLYDYCQDDDWLAFENGFLNI